MTVRLRHEARFLERTTPAACNWFGTNWHVLTAIAAYAIVAVWLMTDGDFRLFRREHPIRHEFLYDSMAANLMRGRLDVTVDGVEGEGFYHNGRVYAYNPPVPALPRMLLDAVWPERAGSWSKFICLLLGVVSVTSVIMIYRLFSSAAPAAPPRRVSESLLAIATGLGSTLTFLASRAYFYHEAILWGAALGMLSVFFLFKFWHSGFPHYLVAGATFAALAYLSRYSGGGMGAVLAAICTCLLALGHLYRRHLPAVLKSAVPFAQFATPARLKMAIVAACGVLAATAGFYFWYNNARFGSPWAGQPLNLQPQYTKSRLAHVNGTLVNPWAVPRSFLEYWLAAPLKPTASFPWLAFDTPALLETDTVKYDVVEPHVALAISCPALFVLALLGLISSVIRIRENPIPFLLLVTVGAGSLIVLAYVAISERYAHDFYPCMAVGAALGAAVIDRLRSVGWRRILLTAVGAMAAYSAFVMPALAFVYQRDLLWIIPEQRRVQLRALTASVDGVLTAVKDPSDSQPAQAAAVSVCSDAPVTSDGARIRYYDCGLQQWREVSKGMFAALAVKMPAPFPGRSEPLLSVGYTGAADLVFVKYDVENRIRLGIDHWGSPSILSREFTAAPGKWMRVSILLDASSETASVWVNGTAVVSQRFMPHNWSTSDMVIGANTVGASMDPRFRGTIVDLVGTARVRKSGR